MAYFAKLGTGNIVETVVVVNDSIATTEQAGIDFLNNLYGSRDVWKQTFIDGSQRKNYAGTGYTYDETKDAFIPQKPFNSWILNETTCQWEAPVAKPELTQEQINNKNYYSWNEETQQWDLNE
jgi:hypothetical protein|tara:strand:+ start:101 stop:469 length:369 start_codon:yes stop_codon:yes gene_type:complete